MNTTTEKSAKRRIVLFENEDSQNGTRQYIAECRNKLAEFCEAYNQVRESAPEFLPALSFDVLSRILRAKSVRDWLFDTITGNNPLHVGGFELTREMAMAGIKYPAGSDRLMAAARITTSEKNSMEECFSIDDGLVHDNTEAIERKIDASRRYCNEIETQFWLAAERISEVFNELLQLRISRGFEPSLISMNGHPDCLKIHVERKNSIDHFSYRVNSQWVLNNSR